MLGLEAFMARPRFNQCAVDRKMLLAQQARLARLFQNGRKEFVGDLTVQKPHAILGEDGHVPGWVVHIESDEPTIKHVVLQLLHHHALTAHGIEHLEQLEYNVLYRWFVGLNMDDPTW